jgi:hypothetical protein
MILLLLFLDRRIDVSPVWLGLVPHSEHESVALGPADIPHDHDL